MYPSCGKCPTVNLMFGDPGTLPLNFGISLQLNLEVKEPPLNQWC